jgi:hypothetical protein
MESNPPSRLRRDSRGGDADDGGHRDEIGDLSGGGPKGAEGVRPTAVVSPTHDPPLGCAEGASLRVVSGRGGGRERTGSAALAAQVAQTHSPSGTAAIPKQSLWT